MMAVAGILFTEVRRQQLRSAPPAAARLCSSLTTAAQALAAPHAADQLRMPTQLLTPPASPTHKSNTHTTHAHVTAQVLGLPKWYEAGAVVAKDVPLAPLAATTMLFTGAAETFRYKGWKESGTVSFWLLGMAVPAG